MKHTYLFSIALALMTATVGNSSAHVIQTAFSPAAIQGEAAVLGVAETEGQPLTFTTVTCADSTQYASTRYVVAYPTEGSGPLLSAVRNYICRFIAPTLYNDDGSEGTRPVFTGDKSNAKAVVSFFQQTDQAQLEKGAKETIALMEDDNPWEGITSTSYMTLRFYHQTAKFLTLTHETYNYDLGAAHGLETAGGVTFSKLTGKQVNRVVNRQKTRLMQALLKQGIYRSFKRQDPTITRAQALASLQCGNTIPLPEREPYFGKNGVVFTYQPYEIACYAAGIISFTVPYSQMLPYLTAEAKALVPQGK